MGRFGVRPEKEQELLDGMKASGLREEDLDEKFVHSGGKGGQNVNKTSTCVWLKHIPSGLEVKVQKERSQNLNRFLARRLLLEKFRSQVLGEKTAADVRLLKIRKQKKRRRRRNQGKHGENTASDS
ncbi:MAG TPA: peptide chain release factor-like protein [Verrucomicrobiae bacterium]|jgi:protein subunit release factor B|nr:peptide chain release factor-like protein [Verrucomicrobiae bacterium]